ncbi:precorrin-6y C5,15-methyltransferase (decarboxylating) subunit CbiE [Saccharopolyspora sp. HNM0986]|uniref:precorrin-6y C5,15-methyltransferase (decarboxylating) subunit CbiE n=2 Tax=Saccharopolyspora TaxID=1835 RepID=UPI0027DC1048|nr:precorrin-6y C5,15-methyltransferase (decarboxylating) subunit CbiE [Saccharopolyspora sp. HNM0986]MBK0867395.1 precorrin-6y C5,15-methyltransferase (decarboxylating) subunit CbiE [Saccharopolyspora sp. HNM0986]
MSAQRKPVDVVGIGADGWDGLSAAAQRRVRDAEVLFGSRRQLDLVPEPAQELVEWPSPMLPALPGLFEQYEGRAICVLASGDPMFHGIGSTLARVLGAERLRVLPHVSSVSLACARMGWPAHDTQVVSLVGKHTELLHPQVQPGSRLLVLSSDEHTPAQVAALLVARDFGSSEITVLGDLGAPEESRLDCTAAQWPSPQVSALNVVAVHCRADPDAQRLPRTPGLPDEAFLHDGQLTKRDVRALTLARLGPMPGELLWDVGAGAGSIAIEWMRADESCRAVAIEHREDRAARVTTNALSLGVPGLRLVVGAAPEALDGLDPPDAIFVGGGSTAPGVLDACWNALRPGGRLVVNAVTIESEVLVADWYGRCGGELVRISSEHASPVGGFTGWRPAMRITQWAVTKR